MRSTSYGSSSYSGSYSSSPYNGSYSLPLSSTLSNSKAPSSSSYTPRRLSSNSTSGTSYSTDTISVLSSESNKDTYGSSYSSQNARGSRKSSLYSSSNSDRRSPEPNFEKYGQRYVNRTEGDILPSSSSARSNAWRGTKESREENSSWPATGTQRRSSREQLYTTNRSESVDAAGSSRSRTASLDSDPANSRLPRSLSTDPRRSSLSRQGVLEVSPTLPQNSIYTGNNSVYGTTQREKEKTDEKVSISEQQIFVQRLLQAHNIVDELLRSRGMKPEDERNYLRMWEQIPIIREEVIPSRLSRSSSASDSGLSMDNDSDHSQHAEAALARRSPPPSEECSNESLSTKEADREAIEFVWYNRNFLCECVLLAIRLPKVKKPEKEKCPDISVEAKPLEIKEHKKEALVLKKSPEAAMQPKLLEVQAQAKPKESALQAVIPKVTVSTNAQQQWKRVTQRSTLARFHGPRDIYAPGSAEISVQHVSFYQVASSLIERRAPAERSVRVHLRLTQRVSPSLETSIIVVLKLRVIHVSFKVRMNSRARRRLRRSHTVDTSQLSRSRSPSLLQHTVPAHARKKEPINPIRIPENFLKPLHSTSSFQKEQSKSDTRDEIRMARGNLKRVAFNKTVSHTGLAVYWVNEPGFHQSPKSSPSSPSSPLAQSPPSTCKEPPVRADSDPRAAHKKIEVLLDNKRKSLKDSKNESNFLRRAVTLAKDTLATDRSKKQIPTFEKEAPATDRSKKPVTVSSVNDIIDKKLISEYRRHISIPRPTAVIHISNSSPLCEIKKEPKVKPVLRQTNSVEMAPPATFLHRKTPERIVTPQKELPISENAAPTPVVVLKPIKQARNRKPLDSSSGSRNCKPAKSAIVPRTQCSGTFGVTLKRLVRSLPENEERGSVTHATPKKPWVPKWRRVERIVDEDAREERALECETREKKDCEQPGDDNRKHQELSQQHQQSMESLNEAKIAMVAARERHEREEKVKLHSYEQLRRIEREKEAVELKALKEKQERRRLERIAEEHELEERRLQEEARKKQKEEDRKALAETKKRKKQEQKQKQREATLGCFSTVPENTRSTLVSAKAADSTCRSANVVQKNQSPNATKGEQRSDGVRRSVLSAIEANVKAGGQITDRMREKIRTMHKHICRFEADKYDLETRTERQDYDLKELNERQRQVARSGALNKGLDPSETLLSRHPQKVPVTGQYDRQIDHRNFTERRAMFEKVCDCVSAAFSVEQQKMLCSVKKHFDSAKHFCRLETQ